MDYYRELDALTLPAPAVAAPQHETTPEFPWAAHMFANVNDDALQAFSQAEGFGAVADLLEHARRAATPAPAATPSKSHIKRPPNAFFLYRSDKLEEVRAELGTAQQNSLSKVLAERWNNETPEVRQIYKDLAEQVKADHLARYPNYRFNPRRGRHD